MPLTIAHPAAILPFSRQSKYIHFSAVVLGSMAPDFEYFLRGRPVGEIGHSFTGFFTFNLPLFLQDTANQRTSKSKLFNVMVFSYSALFGMLTHVVWDSFTHKNGFIVTQVSILAEIMPLFGLQIPLYKYLQHGSTLVGITLIIGYVYYRAANQPKKSLPSIQPKQKLIFWLQVLGLAFFYVCIWYLINEVSLRSYGVWVVRFIDSSFLSLLTICLLQTSRQNNITVKGLP